MVEVPRHAAATLAAALRAGAFVTIVVTAASFGLSGATSAGAAAGGHRPFNAKIRWHSCLHQHVVDRA